MESDMIIDMNLNYLTEWVYFLLFLCLGELSFYRLLDDCVCFMLLVSTNEMVPGDNNVFVSFISANGKWKKSCAFILPPKYFSLTIASSLFLILPILSGLYLET